MEKVVPPKMFLAPDLPVLEYEILKNNTQGLATTTLPISQVHSSQTLI